MTHFFHSKHLSRTIIFIYNEEYIEENSIKKTKLWRTNKKLIHINCYEYNSVAIKCYSWNSWLSVLTNFVCVHEYVCVCVCVFVCACMCVWSRERESVCIFVLACMGNLPAMHSACKIVDCKLDHSITGKQ